MQRPIERNHIATNVYLAAVVARERGKVLFFIVAYFDN